MEKHRLSRIIEALIFASDIPLSLKQTAEIVKVSLQEIEEAIQSLNESYSSEKRAFEITKAAGGYHFITHSDYYPWLQQLFKGKRRPRLSRAALETLAIIAYRQPVSRPEIELIRGVNIDGVVHTLLERRFVAISGRRDGPGRPLLYVTTPEFLRYFGLNSLEELPNLREIGEIFSKQESVSEEDEAQ